MVDKPTKETRVDIIIRFFQNNKLTASMISLGIIIITTAQVIQSGDSILRTFGLRKYYDVNVATNRGRFSNILLENAWNRMFWMRSYTERVRLNAPSDEQRQAYQKYIDATEKWSSNIMNYYLGLEEYYPNTNKRELLESTIQPQFIRAGQMITGLKYGIDTMSKENIIAKVDTIQNLVNSLNPDFYFLIDQPVRRR
ncbi:hypothetical protein L3C95_18095 [Chitinophaga filiformis]|uniref:hypothetical protein n=1 Tax=Chitinophaga filiformis TaxID=104663 RepID=UPI001F4508C8|nr:hypothetical protein [Chitinophaga filiformis]MCF6404816.1 hypothetical protein [Chitinophaga filiformis]